MDVGNVFQGILIQDPRFLETSKIILKKSTKQNPKNVNVLKHPILTPDPKNDIFDIIIYQNVSGSSEFLISCDSPSPFFGGKNFEILGIWVIQNIRKCYLKTTPGCKIDKLSQAGSKKWFISFWKS